MIQKTRTELTVHGATVKQRWRRRAETPGLVEIIERNGPGFAVPLFVEEQPHCYAHPEVLRGLDPPRRFRHLVNDQIAVIKRLYSKEIKLKVRRRIERFRKPRKRRIERFRKPRKVVFGHPWIQPIYGDPVLDVLLEDLQVRFLKLPHAVPHDVPAKHLLVDVGELDPSREFRKIRIPLDQRL